MGLYTELTKPRHISGVLLKVFQNPSILSITAWLFEINAGVLQGDILAPFLFTIVLDYAMRKAMAGSEDELGFTLSHRKFRRHPKEILADLDLADDIAFLSDAINQARVLLYKVESQCRKVRLGLNGSKTKSIAYNVEDLTPPENSWRYRA